MNEKPAAARNIAVESLSLYYYLPLKIRGCRDSIDERELSKYCWRPESEIHLNSRVDQSYFEKTFTELMSGGEEPANVPLQWYKKQVSYNHKEFEAYIKIDPKDAKHDGKEPKSEETYTLGFLAQIESVELAWPKDKANPLAMICVEIKVKKYHDSKEWKPLNLAAAQDAIDYLRRVRPEYANSIKRVHFPKLQKGDMEENGDAVFPWIVELINPIPSCTIQASDARSYMASAINLASSQDNKPSEVKNTCELVQQCDLWRLAEADASAPKQWEDKFEYSEDFLDQLCQDTFYTRHWLSENSRGDKATIYWATHHHVGALTSGFSDIAKHFSTIYRHMYFICIYEYFWLIIFEDELASASIDGDAEELIAKRREFIEFQQKFHFTVVTSRLQGREIYAKFRKATGVDDLFERVSKNIQSSTDFALALNAQKLNKMVAFWIPVTIAVGFAGMNILAGQWTAKIPYLGCYFEKHTLFAGLIEFMLYLVIFCGIFKWFNRASSKSK